MKPIYFPFTYISDPIAEALASCFKQTVVYSPSSHNMPGTMEKWLENGVLDIHAPATKDQARLDAVIKDYKDWANIHQEGGMAFFKSHRDTIPFFDDTCTSQIRASVKKNYESGLKDYESQKPDPLFNARLFLHIAQDFDVQNWEITRDIDLSEDMQQEFMKELKGEDSEFPIFNSEFLIPGNDPGLYMTSERIEAWNCLMQHDPENSGLYVTSSRSVFEHMTEKAPEGEMVFSFDSIPVYKEINSGILKEISLWRDSLIGQADVLAKNTWPVSVEDIVSAPNDTGCDRKVSFKLYIIPGETPAEFFDRCVGHEISGISEKGIRNTLVGLVE